MCQSMVDIQPAAAEIRRGKKEEEEDRRKETTGQKYNGPLLHRAAINSDGSQLKIPSQNDNIRPIQHRIDIQAM